MSAATLLAQLNGRGVMLSPNGDRLHIVAPSGVLSDELRGAIRELKPALLEFLAHPLLMQELLKEHPHLNTPADVAALREYFSELPRLPGYTSAYCDELRAVVPSK